MKINVFDHIKSKLFYHQRIINFYYEKYITLTKINGWTLLIHDKLNFHRTNSLPIIKLYKYISYTSNALSKYNTLYRII